MHTAFLQRTEDVRLRTRAQGTVDDKQNAVRSASERVSARHLRIVDALKTHRVQKL